MHSREQVYRALWEHTDRMGVIKPSQQEMAAILGIPYQRLSLIYTEFQHMDPPRMKKYRHQFQIKPPETWDWVSPAYKEAAKAGRPNS